MLGSEDRLLDTLGATVVCGNGSFSAFDLIHRLVTDGLLQSSHTELALRLEERVSVIRTLPAAASLDPPAGSSTTEGEHFAFKPLDEAGSAEARQAAELPVKAEGYDRDGSFSSVSGSFNSVCDTVIASAAPDQANLVCGSQVQQQVQHPGLLLQQQAQQAQQQALQQQQQAPQQALQRALQQAQQAEQRAQQQQAQQQQQALELAQQQALLLQQSDSRWGAAEAADASMYGCLPRLRAQVCEQRRDAQARAEASEP